MRLLEMALASPSRSIAVCMCILAIPFGAACSGTTGFDGAMGRSLEAFPAARIATDTMPPEDHQVERLLATLDSLLALPETRHGFESDGRTYIRYFGMYLEKALLTPEQTDAVVVRLDEIANRYPVLGEDIDDQRYRTRNLIPGKIPPNIVGKDTDGREFRLDDYRGRIVVLIFSGDWCPPCREEYPHQRRMLERYRDRNVVLLGVNSDRKLETIQRVKEEDGLDYRTWWDGAAPGPISVSWKVWAYPETYVLAEDGIILHVGKRGEQLVEAIDRLLARRLETGGAEGIPPSS